MTGGKDPYSVESDASKDGAPLPSGFDTPFSTSELHGVHIATLERRDVLDAHDIERLGESLKRFTKSAKGSKVVVDLANVRHLSSSAIGMLITLRSFAQEAGGDITLANANKELAKILKVMKPHKVLRNYDNITKAVDALGPEV